MTLDRESYVPLYEQVSDYILDYIKTSGIQAGKPIPSTRTLEKMLGVSRVTIISSINKLVEEGILIRKHGKGIFVNEPKIVQPLTLVVNSFTDIMKLAGYMPSTRVLEIETMIGSRQILEHLNIPVGSKILKFSRVRLINNVPIILSTSYLPYELVKNLNEEDLINYSLYDLLKNRCNLTLARTSVTFEPTLSTLSEGKILGISAGRPMMLLRSKVWSQYDEVIEYSKVLYRGDRILFKIDSV